MKLTTQKLENKVFCLFGNWQDNLHFRSFIIIFLKINEALALLLLLPDSASYEAELVGLPLGFIVLLLHIAK